MLLVNGIPLVIAEYKSYIASAKDWREAVHQLQKRLVFARHAYLFDDAVRNAAATVHCGTRGLVDNQQVLVLEQYWRHGRRNPGNQWAGGDMQRRNSDLVAQNKPLVDIGARAVDAHLAAAHDAIDMALGYSLGELQQEVVEPLAGAFITDRDVGHLIGCNR